MKNEGMKNAYTIGEIGKLFHIGADSLRYYERLGILAPGRGENGYRLYGADDIWRLNIIRDLRELGMSMESIGEYMKNRSLASTRALLEKELSETEEKIARLQRLKDNMEERLRILSQAQKLPAGEISEKALPPRRCRVIEEGYASDSEMNLLMRRLLRREEDERLIGSNCIGSFFAPDEGAGRYTSAFLINENGPREIPGGRYLSVIYRGGYHQTPAFAARMMKFAGERNLRILLPFLELLWADVHETSREEEFATELQVRLGDAPKAAGRCAENGRNISPKTAGKPVRSPGTVSRRRSGSAGTGSPPGCTSRRPWPGRFPPRPCPSPRRGSRRIPAARRWW